MQHNDFGVSFSTISFMMRVLESRNSFISYDRTDDIVFHVTFDDSNEDFTFILEGGYITSAARVRELHMAFPEVPYIVLGGSWWKATNEAYEEADDLGIEILLFKEFLTALRRKKMP